MQFRKVVARVGTFVRRDSQECHVFDNRVLILLPFLGRIGIVEAKDESTALVFLMGKVVIK